MIAPVLLLGVGNPFRRDDGIGPALVAALAGRAGPWCDVRAERGDDFTRILAAWEGREAAVVVDATDAPLPPGTLRRHDGAALAALPAADPSTHGFGLAGALSLSRALGTLPPLVSVLTVTGADFGHGEGLSPPLAARFDALCGALAAALADARAPPRLSQA